MVKKSVVSKKKPNLTSGLVIDQRCLVVDESGKLWWIDPDAGIIRQAIPK